MTKKFFTSIVFALLFCVNNFAHEYWFEPETFFPALNQKTAVHLYVGDGLIKDREERVYQAEKTDLFQLFSTSKILDLKLNLTEEQMPIYNFSAEKTGNYLLVMKRNWSYIKLEPQKFEDYLREDGMEYIIAEREKLGEREKEGRERYSRYIKSLLQVGDKRDNTYKKKLGMKLEIMPLENPYSKKIGDKSNFQILFNGKPLVGKTVFADNRESETQKMTTDKDGKFSMKIEKKGLWLVRLVYMQRCKIDCSEADWESFWGAFSFGA
ncbi:MAG: DUF4198 domain-containing protein [Acidobacteriota bacterium]